MDSSDLPLRVAILVAAATPIGYGLAALFHPSGVVRFTWIFSRGRVEFTPDTRYLIKPLGLYILMFGLMLAWSATDPERYRVVIWWGAAVLFLRGLQRILIAKELETLFGIPYRRNLANVLYVFVVAGTLVALSVR
jgi:hypothetical protein